jgi:hypothetical protein
MKLVREHINEKFTSDSDPITDMGIGIDAISFKLKGILLWGYIHKTRREYREWLNDDQIIEVLNHPYSKMFNFGEGGIAISVKEVFFLQENHMVYDSIRAMLSDNLIYIKYDGKYYNIQK